MNTSILHCGALGLAQRYNQLSSNSSFLPSDIQRCRKCPLKPDVTTGNLTSVGKKAFVFLLWVAERGGCTGRVMCEVFKVLTAEKKRKKIRHTTKMLIFVACIDVIITLITLILLLFIIEIIIPINVILMTTTMMMIINACYRFDQWFTHCLSITLQHEINYSLKKKKKKRDCTFRCPSANGSEGVARPRAPDRHHPAAVTRQHDGHFNSDRPRPPLSLALRVSV